MGRLALIKRLKIFPVLIILILSCLGLLMLYSAANGNFYPWCFKQACRLGLGFALMIFVALTDSRYWLGYSYLLYAIAFILLLAVETMGFVGMGAQRWLNLYAFNLQPSEIMRVGLVLALARYFHKYSPDDIAKPQKLIVPFLMVLCPTLLVMRQPDLGTAMLLIMSGAAIFFTAGVRIWKFLALGGTCLACIPVFWSMLHNYQKLRILTFLNPELDPMKSGYHVTQSKIALGSGGIFGKGFLKGTQSHLNFLPEKQTDFIFTMYSEEFGMVGAIILVILYGLLIASNFKMALRARSQFSRLAIIGLTTTFFLYAFINMAMVMGFLPVVGVPLPFMSYGGTALMTLLISQGLIFSIDLQRDLRVTR